MMPLGQLSPIERLAAVTEAVDSASAADIIGTLQPLCCCVEEPDLEMLGSSPAAKPFLAILCCLQVFDRCLESLADYKGHIYLLGDGGVHKLLWLRDQADPALASELDMCLEVLSTCGLIYRFNVAVKFGYPARGIMQLRINGWGRHLSDALGLATTSVARALRESTAEMLEPHRDAYIDMLALCSSEHRPLNVAAIHRLNDLLPLKVVT